MRKRRIKDSVKIAPGLRVEDWKRERLQLVTDIRENRHNPDLWEKAFTHFLERIQSRFLGPIEWILAKHKDKGEGFAVVALECILIEFLEACYRGKVYTTSSNPQPYEYNSSREMFCGFLMGHKPFSSVFKKRKSADGFYSNIRCALLHEASTKETSSVKRNARGSNFLDFVENDEKNFVVYRENLYKAICQYIDWYKSELFESKELKVNFIRKIDDICQINREYYFAYGSNLDKTRFLARISKFHTGTKAILVNFKFEYNKRSADGTTKANIMPAEGSEVHGACYEIDEDDLCVLDGYERGYKRKEIRLADPEARAITYISESVIRNVRPSDEYRCIILGGAQDWLLDKNYINNNL